MVIYGGNSAFSVKVEKNRRCNLFTHGSTDPGLHEDLESSIEDEEKSSRE